MAIVIGQAWNNISKLVQLQINIYQNPMYCDK